MPDDASLTARRPSLPAWYPSWAKSLADLYFSGTTCVFIVHGNVHDLIRCGINNETTYCNLPEFLAGQLFGAWGLVLHYDVGRGLRPLAGSNPDRLKTMMQALAPLGEPGKWPREPDNVLLILDKFIERSLLED